MGYLKKLFFVVKYFTNKKKKEENYFDFLIIEFIKLRDPKEMLVLQFSHSEKSSKIELKNPEIILSLFLSLF